MKIQFSAFGVTFRADITGYVAACPQTFDDPGADAEYTIENLEANVINNGWIPCQWMLLSSLQDEIEEAADIAVGETIQSQRDEARMDQAESRRFDK